MTTPRPSDTIHARDFYSHWQRNWIRKDDGWIDAVLEQARSAIDIPLGHNMSSSGVTRIVDVTGDSEVILKIADSLTILGHIQRIWTKEQVQEEYISVVKNIPEVVKVILVEEDEGQALLTVISATPFEDEPRNKVFDAQIEVMERMERPLLGFHLVNIEELPGRSLEKQGSMAGKVLWGR